MEQDLVMELHRLGIKLRLTDGRLDVVAPAGSLTPRLREELRERREELIALLSRTETGQGEYRLVPRPEERHEPFALTDIQHAYWIGHNRAFELGGVATHFYFELEREGLDVSRLERSLRKVIDRHDMLRALIEPDGRQRVLPEVPAYELRCADHSGATHDAYEAQIAAVRAEMGHQVLPPDRWPLFDIRATRRDRRLRLHVSLDLLILDAFSIDVFFRDWQRFYEDESHLPGPLDITYRDHVLAEESQRGGARHRAAEEYWTGRLDSLPAAPELPLARQPSQLERTAFVRRRASLPRVQWDALKRRAREHGVTPSSVLLTAFSDVVRLWSKQPDFTLNLTLFNRPSAPERISEVIGDFTSLTLLEVHGGQEPFARRADRLQQQLMRDLEHLSYSGVRVLRERSRRSGGGAGGAMPIVFTSALGFATEADTMDGMSFFGTYVYGISQTPQVWLDHQVMEEQGSLVFNWDAVESLFPDGLLDDMFVVYRGLLDRLSSDERAWRTAAPLISPPPWQLVERARANDTATALPDSTLIGVVAERAARQPDAVAVVCDDAQYTYGEVIERAYRLAHRLTALGARTGHLVAVVLEKCLDQIPAVLGVVASGAAYLPIDPQWPDARRDRLLESGRVRIVVTTSGLRDTLSWPEDVRVVTFSDTEVAEADPTPPATTPAPEDLAYVIFTSGSTGRPKGVMIDHRGALNTLHDINRRFGIGPSDRVLALSALSFDLSVYDIFGTLAAGATVVMPAASRSQEPAYWSELAERHGVTVWNSVPALMQLWTDATRPGERPAVSPLRLVLLSGDWIPVALPGAVRARHPRAEVVGLGGATEASIWSVCFPIGEVPATWTRIPYGKPLANQTLHVYDQDLRECPVWTVGEIYIGGTGVATGYWADPERTAERFVHHGETGETLYRTGDLGRRLPDGNIEFLGREDFQVKLNGYRIELGEIAAALNQQPGVEKAIVSVDINPGTGRRQLVAHVVPTGDRTVQGSQASLVGDAWPALLAAGNGALRQGLADLEEELADYRGAWQALEEACVPIMARTLARLGVFTSPGDTATAEEIAERAGAKAGYQGLIHHWLDALTAHGLLCPADRHGAYRCADVLDATALDTRVRAVLRTVRATGPGRVFADYLANCAEHQVDLLRGRVNPLQLLMPDGSRHVTDMLYAENPVSALQNRIAAEVVAERVACHRGDGPVRILELGAGTGATTAQVLPRLPAERVRYRFTDVSTFFTERARHAFAGYDFVDYGVCDIDRDFTPQGYEPGSADIVVAANVLHDATDLGACLGHVRQVLAPGGALVLIEGTENSVIQMVTVGFIEGFSHHQGRRDLPLLRVDEWRGVLKAASFERATAIPEADAATDMMVQHVLLAESAVGAARPDPAELRGALAGLLPDYMVPHHYLFIDRIPLSANGKVDVSALPTPWDEESEESRVAPRDDTESALLAVWQDVLGNEEFGVESNFFELGGDSLHAVHVLARLREDYPLGDDADDELRLLFENPTVASLAAALTARAEGRTP